MTLQRLFAGLLLAVASAIAAGSAAPDLVAADETPKQKTAEKKKAFFKKLLAEKKKAEPTKPNTAEAEKSKPETAAEPAAQQPTRPTGKPLDYKAVAALIDRQIDKQLADAKVVASPRTDDAEFVRRVYLDVTGVIPAAEKVQSFLDSTDPEKRSKLVDELLESSNYGRRVADVWMGVLYPFNDSENRFVQKEPLAKWLAENFNENKPWDKMAYELLTATGEQDQNGATTYFMVNRGVDKITDNIAKAFLGVQLQCAQCHNHPFTSWKQTEYWGMAQFFMKVSANVQRNAKTAVTAGVTEAERPNRRLNPLPESAKTVNPKFLGGPEVKLPAGEPYRPVFAKWATDGANPYFARAMVNRTWSLLFGRGFVNPVDDMLKENEPSHPELLAALAREFTLSGFDLKHLVRAICNSQTYQRSGKPLPGNKADQELFSHQAIKALTPEQLFDSITVVVGSQTEGRQGGRPGQAQRGAPRSQREQFAQFFQPGESAKPTDYDAGIPQALRLMNAPRLSSAPGLVGALAKGAKPDQVVEKLYLMTVSRRPTPDEVKRLTSYAAKQPDAATAYGDILWALLNSSEFTLNR